MLACNGEPPPEPEPCDGAREAWPECEATGGRWVEHPERAVDVLYTCDCECPEGTTWTEGEGCEVDPEPCEVKPEDCESGMVDYEKCECKPWEPVAKNCGTPPKDRLDEDYIPLNRADFWKDRLTTYDQRLIWNGVRNPLHAMANCPPGSAKSVWPYNGVSYETAESTTEIANKVKVALTGEDGESKFWENVGIQHPTRRTGRSKAYRPCLDEHFSLARWLTDGCVDEGATLAECGTFNQPSEATGVVSQLDGIKKACEDMSQ